MLFSALNEVTVKILLTFSFIFSKVPPWAITVFDCTSKINPDKSEESERNECSEFNKEEI